MRITTTPLQRQLRQRLLELLENAAEDVTDGRMDVALQLIESARDLALSDLLEEELKQIPRSMH